MRHRLIGIGATIATVIIGAAFVTAQGTTGQGQAGQPPVVQGQVVPPQGPGGPGPGMGPGQGMGRGARGQGPQAGRGGPMMGTGRTLGMGPQGRGRGGLFAALDLTEDQRAAVTDLQRAARDQAAPFEDELQFAQKTLHRELFADKRDAAKITALTTKIAALQKQLADARLKTAGAMSDLLTPKQRETMRLAGHGFGRGGRR